MLVNGEYMIATVNAVNRLYYIGTKDGLHKFGPDMRKAWTLTKQETAVKLLERVRNRQVVNVGGDLLLEGEIDLFQVRIRYELGRVS